MSLSERRKLRLSDEHRPPARASSPRRNDTHRPGQYAGNTATAIYCADSSELSQAYPIAVSARCARRNRTYLHDHPRRSSSAIPAVLIAPFSQKSNSQSNRSSDAAADIAFNRSAGVAADQDLAARTQKCDQSHRIDAASLCCWRPSHAGVRTAAANRIQKRSRAGVASEHPTTASRWFARHRPACRSPARSSS